VITDATARGIDEAARAVIAASSRVFDSCLLPNGGLMAAPCHLLEYPLDAPGRFQCLPGRDIPLAIAGMRLLGRDVKPMLTPWLFDRALANGYLVHLYNPNGLPASTGNDNPGARLIAAAIGTVSHPNRVLLAEGSGVGTVRNVDDLVEIILDRIPDGSVAGDSIPLWVEIMRLARTYRPDHHDVAVNGLLTFAALADERGHLPEWSSRPGSPRAPRPSLPSHMAFVIAAHVIGALPTPAPTPAS
jgi:hypothetical protein